MPKRGGRRSGAGRKSKAEETGLQQLLAQCISAADRKVHIRELNKRAKKGEKWALELLLAYLYGKPKQMLEQSGSVHLIVLDE